MTGMIILVALIAATLLGALVLSVRPADIGAEERGGAALTLNETNLAISAPVALSGRPDQVWRGKDGVLVIVDTKRRREARVFQSDRVRLSAYRFLLRQAPRFRNDAFADHGFIRVEYDEGRARFDKVTLMSDDEIVSLHTRTRGPYGEARLNPSKALCRGCGHRGRCADAV